MAKQTKQALDRIGTDIFITATGPIVQGPSLFYTKDVNRAVCSFALRVMYKVNGEVVKQFFNFVAWETLAEYIATHYCKTSVITVLKAIPYQSSKMIPGRTGPWKYLSWNIVEIGVPPGGGVRPGTVEHVPVTNALLGIAPADEEEAV